MFDNLKNMASLMKAASEAKQRMAEVQRELERRTATGESGGGAVRVTLNGKMEVRDVHFDPVMIQALVGDDDQSRAMIQDLTAAAITDAISRIQQVVQEEMSKATGGLDLPGLQNMLGS